MFLKRMEKIKPHSSSKGNPDRDSEMDYGDEDLENDLPPDLVNEHDENMLNLVIDRFEASLEKLSAHNYAELKRQYSRFTSAYSEAEEKAKLII